MTSSNASQKAWPTASRWQRTLQSVGVQNPNAKEEQAFIRRQLKMAARQKAFLEKHRTQFNQLTAREREILALVASGYNNPKIAKRLFISRNTVEQHRKNINRKLATNQLHVMIQYAQAFGLL